MPLMPWIGREPVQVDQIQKVRRVDTLKRVVVGNTFNVPGTLGPDATHTWELESVNLEVLTSAAAGTRVFYFYYAGSRYLCSTGVGASSVVTFLALPGGGFSDNFVVGANQFSVEIPLPLKVLDNPFTVGFMWANFQDAGDIVNTVFVYRESERFT